jgi:hypothetical protein
MFCVFIYTGRPVANALTSALVRSIMLSCVTTPTTCCEADKSMYLRKIFSHFSQPQMHAPKGAR